MPSPARLTVGILLASAALAGCLREPSALPPAAAGEPPSAPAGAPAGLTLGPCLEQFAFLPVPMAVAQRFMPEGFTPVAFDAAGLTAVMAGVGFRCERVEGGGLALGEVRALAGAIAVQPPPRYQNPDVQHYVVPLGGFVSSPELAEVFRAWGLPNVRDADVAFQLHAEGPTARLGDVSATAGAARVDFVTSPAGVQEAQPPSKFRVFIAPGGRVAGAIDWAWDLGDTIETGTALLSASPDNGVFPLPAGAGLGFHYWGPTYVYHLSYVALG